LIDFPSTLFLSPKRDPLFLRQTKEETLLFPTVPRWTYPFWKKPLGRPSRLTYQLKDRISIGVSNGCQVFAAVETVNRRVLSDFSGRRPHGNVRESRHVFQGEAFAFFPLAFFAALLEESRSCESFSLIFPSTLLQVPPRDP